MRRKQETSRRILSPADVTSADQIARRIETYCRRQVPDCRVVTVVDGSEASAEVSLGLRVGPRGGSRGDQLWVRDLDVSVLADREDVDRLARLIGVWIEPQEAVSSDLRSDGSIPPGLSAARSATH